MSRIHDEPIASVHVFAGNLTPGTQRGTLGVQSKICFAPVGLAYPSLAPFCFLPLPGLYVFRPTLQILNAPITRHPLKSL